MLPLKFTTLNCKFKSKKTYHTSPHIYKSTFLPKIDLDIIPNFSHKELTVLALALPKNTILKNSD